MGDQVRQRHPGQSPEQSSTTTQRSPRRSVWDDAGIQPAIRRNRTILQPRIPGRFRDLQGGQDHSRLPRGQIQPTTPQSQLKCLPSSGYGILLSVHLAERQRHPGQTIQQPRRLLTGPVLGSLSQRIHITTSRLDTNTLLGQDHTSTPGRDHLVTIRRRLADIARKRAISTELP